MARSTLWTDVGADTYVGLGQRLLTTDLGDTALMDLRLLEMNAELPEEETATPDAHAPAACASLHVRPQLGPRSAPTKEK